jgi:hypothetical protein
VNLLVVLHKLYIDQHHQLLHQLCVVVGGLGYMNHPVCEVLAAAGVCEVLIAALRTHPNCVDIITVCTEAIHYLAEVPANRRLFGSLHACPSILNVLTKHSDDVNVVFELLKVIGTLALDDPGNRASLHDANVYEVVVRVVGQYSHIPVAAQYGCRAISNLSVSGDSQLHFGAYVRSL